MKARLAFLRSPIGRRLVLLTVLAFVCGFSAAKATAAPAPTAEGDIPIAEEFWGGPPPQCTSVVFLVDQVTTESGWATEPAPGWSGPCELRIHEVGSVGANGVAFSAEYICLAAVHEMGHLHGEGHSPDPASIMYGAGPLDPAAVPACQEPAAPLPAAAPRRHRRFHRGANVPRPR